VITLESVTVRYGSVTAVREVSEIIHDGEWVALIGPNGAGKSTLLRAICGLVEHEGTILVQGGSTAALKRRQLARLIAYVPQQPVLPAEVSAQDYVMLGRTPYIGYFGFEGVEDRRISHALLKRLDLEHLAVRRLDTLSGGELQRLSFARCLAQEAPVLLLDEPTSALDLGRRVEVLELVDEIRRERGLTVLSAMHDLTLAGQFADRLVLMVGGELEAVGTTDEVLAESTLAHHFGTNVRVLRTDDGELVVVPQRKERTP
jgi:iron complex transport system ATP-binding protein